MKATPKIVALLAGSALLAILVVILSFWSFRQIEEASEARKHSHLILIGADDLLSALKDAETGQRGYLLTGDEAFLAPYLAVRAGISGRMDDLRRITLGGAVLRHLDAISPLVDAKMAELSHVI